MRTRQLVREPQLSRALLDRLLPETGSHCPQTRMLEHVCSQFFHVFELQAYEGIARSICSYHTQIHANEAKDVMSTCSILQESRCAMFASRVPARARTEK